MISSALVVALAATAWSPPSLRPHAGARARAVPHMASSSLTEQIMTKLDGADEQSGGAGGATTYEALLRLDDAWTKLRAGELPPPRKIVFEEPEAAAETPDYDLVVAGGNIGILLATALVLRGLRVAVLEAGPLRGRAQDWNASRKEVMELVEAGVISLDEVDEIIGVSFNPVRCGFPGGEDVWLNASSTWACGPIGSSRSRARASRRRAASCWRICRSHASLSDLAPQF